MHLSTTKGIHEASYAIVTVPLGVLKAGSITFKPPLPSAKLGAIQRLDMANLEKVVLVFDEPFWSPLGEALTYIGDPVGEFPWFVDFTETAGQPTLLCLFGGATARRTLETQSDDQIIARTLEILSEMTNEDIPTPQASYVTRWKEDPWSRGSYSYLPVGASAQDMHELSRPVGQRLFFAGEATVARRYGTVHGAMLSGRREAERVLEALAKKSSYTSSPRQRSEQR